MKIKRIKTAATAAAALLLVSFAVCYAAYVGHEADRDMKIFLATFPQLKNTQLDNCLLCHRDGEIADTQKPGKTKHVNACDYCHTVFMEKGNSISLTLNNFGRDYLDAGRDAKAFAKIASKDSDGDKISNSKELKSATLPGDEKSKPGLKTAPSVAFTIEKMKKSASVVEQTIFMNSTKSKSGDSYSSYRGVRLIDLLKAAGMAPGTKTVEVISADGYEKTFSVEELKKTYKQGPPYFSLDTTALGDCGWVHYNTAGLTEGKALPDANIILAFEENGAPLSQASLEVQSGKLLGDGPYRLITPQNKIYPPDLPQFADASCPGKVPELHRFHSEYDHNAGNAARSVVAIRINPLPKGTHDIDWAKSGWEAIAHGKIIVYGALKKK